MAVTGWRGFAENPESHRANGPLQCTVDGMEIPHLSKPIAISFVPRAAAAIASVLAYGREASVALRNILQLPLERQLFVPRGF